MQIMTREKKKQLDEIYTCIAVKNPPPLFIQNVI